MTRRADPRVDRTHRIVVEAAAEVLARVGFEQITVDAVAERAGVARSTIYRNWPRRAALWIEAFDRLCPPVATPCTGTLVDDLEALAERLCRGLWNETWGRVIASLVGAAHHDDELLSATRDFDQLRRGVVRDVLRAARERGEIDADDARIDAAALSFAAAFFHLRLTGHDAPTPSVRRSVVANTVAALTAHDER